MRARAKSSVIPAATLVAVLLLPGPSRAQVDPDVEVNPAVKAFDVVVLRPLELAAALVGAGLFPAVALVSAPGGRDAVEEAWEVFVLVPAKRVFRRPLGEF